MIIICSKRKSKEKIQKEYPGCIIADCTSKAKDPLIRLSPFYPHGNIPVPYTNGLITANSVESIWQGLKVFQNSDIDIELFKHQELKGLKRTTKRYGKILGHKRGPDGRSDMLLSYSEARKQIYIPTYRWMLEHYAMDIINRLRCVNKEKTIVLLDYNTNCDVTNLQKPLSHAYLVKAYVEGLYPYEDIIKEKVEHHLYEGRKSLRWTTKTTSYREVNIDSSKSQQLEIPFDLQ